MSSNLKLEIVTPEGRVFSGDIDMVVLPGGAGELGILVGHEPLATSLLPGSLFITQDGKQSEIIIGSGYAEVTGSAVKVLTDTAVKDDAEAAVVAAARKRADQAREEMLTPQQSQHASE